MCTDVVKARSKERVRLMVETVYQSVGDWRIWDYGMQLGSQYMVHEQRSAGKGSECDRVDELPFCPDTGVYVV